MSHDRKGGSEKGRLYAFLLADAVGGLVIGQFDAAVEVASQGRTEQRPQRTAEHVTERAAQQCPPPGHQSYDRTAGLTRACGRAALRGVMRGAVTASSG